MRKELRTLKGEQEKKPVQSRDLNDAIYTPEVLRMLKITPTTLINYEKKGLIKYHKEGRNKVYSRGEIVDFKKLKGRGRKRLSKKLITSLN